MADDSFNVDWAWLYLQVAILAGVAGWELVKRTDRNLYAILIAVAMLVMVQGQTWWMFAEFERSGALTLRQLGHTVSLSGARDANTYIGVSVLCFLLTYLFFSLSSASAVRANSRRSQRQLGGVLFYSGIVGLTVFAGLLLLYWAGGLWTALTKPGQGMVGLTMFLILTGIGKLPILRNLADGSKINALDLALFGLVAGLFLLNSRFLTAFLFLQVVLVFNYCRREIPRRAFIGLAFLMILIFVVFGLYREYTARYDEVRLEPVVEFLTSYADLRGVVDWFYGFNIEGFTGFAGILTYEDSLGAIKYDLGVSELSIVTKFVPYWLRDAPGLNVTQLTEALKSQYPYDESIVPPGFENAYGHFGLSGVLALGGLLGYLAFWLHRRMSEANRDRLLIGAVSVHVLQIVRGSFHNTIFFGISEIVMVVIFRLVLSACGRVDSTIRGIARRQVSG